MSESNINAKLDMFKNLFTRVVGFFKEINKILNKDKSKIEIPIDTLAQHYHEIFNRPLCVTEEVINQVNQKIENDFNAINDINKIFDSN